MTHHDKAVEAAAECLRDDDGWDDWPSNIDLGGNYATGTRDDEYRSDKENLARELLTAALPHLRAEWEQELAEKIRAEAEKIRVAQLAANKGYLPLTIVALLGGYGQAAALLEGGGE